MSKVRFQKRGVPRQKTQKGKQALALLLRELPAIAPPDRSSGEMRREEIAVALMRGVWDSLESHLDYCVENSTEGRAFHRRCVKDYAKMIRLASDLF